MKSYKIRIGKNSWGHFRMGSYLSLTAIFVALGADHVAKWIGTPDAPWIEVVKWGVLAIFTGDIFRALIRLSPRKRWERVMIFGVGGGGALLISALVIYIKSGYREPVGLLLTLGGFTLLVLGLGGWWMWRRARRELNSCILERKMKRKNRKQ